MLFQSEDRVKRLLDESNEQKIVIRQKEREIHHLSEQVIKLNEEVIAKEREFKLREFEL